MNTLRAEVETATDRAEAAESKNKKLEHEILVRDQEIQSLNHQVSLRDTEIDKLEGHVSTAKQAKEAGDVTRTESEKLQRKIQVLEEELDQAEKNAKETVEKYIPLYWGVLSEVLMEWADFVRWTLKRNILNAKSHVWSRSAMSGRRSTRCVMLPCFLARRASCCYICRRFGGNTRSRKMNWRRFQGRWKDCDDCSRLIYEFVFFYFTRRQRVE